MELTPELKERLTKLSDEYFDTDMPMIELLGAVYNLDRNKWISVNESLPEVDKEDEWNSEHQISKDIWTHSKYGMRKGRYYHSADHWTIDNVTSSDGIKVTHWIPL